MRMSIAPMKMFAIVGAALVPMAIPMSCIKSLAPKLNTLNCSTWSNNVIRNAVGIVLSCLESSASLIVSAASLCGMLEYNPITSMETGNVFGGNLVSLSFSNYLGRSGVSWMWYVGI